MKHVFTFFICAIIMMGNCAQQRTAIENFNLGIRENETLRIKDTIDLKGQTIELPQGVTLVSDGGLLYNGKVVGNKTRIKGINTLFSHINIKGTWNVQKIATSLFEDLEYDNSLADVFALTSPEVNNEVVIAKGSYNVSIPSSGRAAITLNSHTKVQLDGDVILRPNAFDICYVFLLNNAKDIKISGKGSIIGDKPNHKAKTGEWGMGIHIVNSTNVDISGITIRDCWGDCIYIGKESSYINIHNCKIDNGRRQGVSITSAKDIKIKNCSIINVGGTPPEYGIDIEPNRLQKVEEVEISDVCILNCSGGIRLYGNAWDSQINNVKVNKCTIGGVTKQIPLSLSSASEVKVNACTVDSYGPLALYMQDLEDVWLLNNTLSAKGKIVEIKASRTVVKKRNKLRQRPQ